MSDINSEIKQAVETAIAGSSASVSSPTGGHFEIRVKAAAFAGKTPLQQQRLVLTAIAHLMKGDDAPVHAIDRIVVET
jgi:stress-induced morphogen